MARTAELHRSRRGEGTISQLGNGSWWGRLTLPNGKRPAVYGKTRAEVQQKLVELRYRLQRGLPLGTDRSLLADYLTDWLRDVARHDTEPSTWRGYEINIRLHIAPGLGHHRLTALTPAHVQAWISQLLAEDYSRRTVQLNHAILRHALAHAVREELVGRNVAAIAQAPRTKPPLIEALTHDTARAVLAAVEGERLEALYVLCLACGLRQGEALALTWSDVDFDEATVSVRRSLARVDRAWLVKEPKTEKSKRVVALPAIVITKLRAHRARQAEERLRAGDRWEALGLVFGHQAGGYLHRNRVVRDFTAALTRAGCAPMRFHDLRHGAASLLLGSGIPLKVVADVLGHSSIALTSDLYGHLDLAAKRPAAAVMDDVLRKREGAG